MKITISHDQDSIDPSATYSDEQFADVRKALESEYQDAIRVTGTGIDDPIDVEDNLQRICETVYAAGLFWI